MLKPLISALLTTLAASALAADYYVVVPVQGRTEAVDLSLFVEEGFYFLYTSASISITYQYDGGAVKTVTKTLPIVIADTTAMM